MKPASFIEVRRTAISLIEKIRENGPASLRAVMLVRQEITANAGRKRSGGGSNPVESSSIRSKLDSKRRSATRGAIARRLIYNSYIQPVTDRKHATRRTVTIIPSHVLNSFGLLTQGFLLATAGRPGFRTVDAGRFRLGWPRPWSSACPVRKSAFRAPAEPSQSPGKPNQGATGSDEGDIIRALSFQRLHRLRRESTSPETSAVSIRKTARAI